MLTQNRHISNTLPSFRHLRLPSPLVTVRKVQVVLRNALHVERVLLDLLERLEAREDDAHDEVVVRVLDVARVEELGQHRARLLRVVRLRCSSVPVEESCGVGVALTMV